MKGRNQTFVSWRFTCLSIIILFFTFPVSHQIRDNQTKNNFIEQDVYNLSSKTPEGSPAMAPKLQSAGISEERVVDVGSCGGGLGTLSPFPVQLDIQHDQVIMDNGLIEVTISKPGGFVTGIRYSGMDNVLEFRNDREDRGYWDIVSGELGNQKDSVQDRLTGTDFRVVKEDENQVELSFYKTWNPSSERKLLPLNVDKRFILTRGCSGFYSYAIFERLEGWPGYYIGETRIAFKLRQDKFNFMAISDNRQRIMPTQQDRSRGVRLDYAEAMLLTNPTNPFFRGEVDDKYQYSSEDQDIRVHGWISSDPNVGFWVITPSDEFRAGGPVKQDLTSHVGPTCLAMFHSCHYAGQELEVTFQNGEPWKKVFGPVLIYLNSASDKVEDPRAALWQDAKRQMMMEVQNWPYSFPVSEDFLKPSQRGSVNGRLLVHNRFSNEQYVWASYAYIGLAPPGIAGSWQRESKGYQFWTRADVNGSFSIRNVLPGEYNLYAWVPGFIGDYKYEISLTISPGLDNNLAVLIYDPPRDAPTIWEIGIPDRSAAEFYIPDPDPKYLNKLYVDRLDSDGRLVKSFDKFRQYGLWARYGELYPNDDLIYRIGVSDYSRDWFYAQSPRKGAGDSFEQTTWQIKFNLANVNYAGIYRLRIALASATLADLQVHFNNRNTRRPHFSTGRIGYDNSIARHGIHGLYWLYNINVPSYLLVRGENTIFLTQSRTNGPFVGFMYDYIRLEGPSVLY